MAYVGLLVAYSAALKHYVIIDVLTLSAGFVLRAVAGAVAIGVPISHWLLVCTTLLALFIGLSKRRHELTLLSDGAAGHRPILQEYSPYLLDQMISVVTAATLVAYSVYTISSETAERLGSDRLGLTIPFVLYGIFRYLYLVHQRNGGGSPSELLLTDRPLLICVALWVAAVVLVIYAPWEGDGDAGAPYFGNTYRLTWQQISIRIRDAASTSIAAGAATTAGETAVRLRRPQGWRWPGDPARPGRRRSDHP